LMLEWSELREDNNCLNDKLLKLTFSRDSNNNKPRFCLRFPSVAKVLPQQNR